MAITALWLLLVCVTWGALWAAIGRISWPRTLVIIIAVIAHGEAWDRFVAAVR
jgi:hypothetical protein